MTETGHTTKGNLTLLRGGLSQPRALSPDEWFDREMQSLFASWKSDEGCGPYASRGIANAAQNINHPHRYLARRVKEARRQRVQRERVRRLAAIMGEYIDRLYGVPVQPLEHAHPNRAA